MVTPSVMIRVEIVMQPTWTARGPAKLLRTLQRFSANVHMIPLIELIELIELSPASFD
jgi:hypothetical protein